VVEQFMPKYGKDWKASVVGSRTTKKDNDQWTEYQIVVCRYVFAFIVPSQC
jgi:hypothetical protein